MRTMGGMMLEFETMIWTLLALYDRRDTLLVPLLLRLDELVRARPRGPCDRRDTQSYRQPLRIGCYRIDGFVLRNRVVQWQKVVMA